MLLLSLLTLHYQCRSASSAPCEFTKTSTFVSEDGTQYVFTSNYRSTPSIVISCLSTILLCTWFAVHPNVCKYQATSWKRLRAKLYLFAWALLVPELVMMFACRQWFGARYIAEKIGNGWTTVEGHFLQMGGFIFRCNGKDEFLGPEGLLDDQCQDPRYKAAREELRNSYKLHVTQDDILDRSKGDTFAKGLVVIQTLWFTIQCIARAVQHLALTELEVITVAYALLNGVTYFFWWDKPLDVQCPIIIKLEFNEITPVQTGVVDGADGYETNEAPEVQGEGHAQGSHAAPESDDDREDEVDDSSGKRPRIGVLRRIWKVVRVCMWTVGSIMLIPLAIAASPLLVTSLALGSTLMDIVSSSSTEWANTHRSAAPSYYGYNIPRGTRYISFIVITLLASLFGAIHCISWSFSFPAPKLRVLWRICSLLITISPLGGVLITAIDWGMKRESSFAVFALVVFGVPIFLGLFLYIPARIVLLVIAFRTLADIPATGHQSIEWAEFIPHI